MLGQLAILHRGLAVLAVDEIQQQGVLVLQLLEQLQGLQPDAVGGVGVAVVIHQLLGVAVGGGLLLLGQLAAQLGKAGVHGGKGLLGIIHLCKLRQGLDCKISCLHLLPVADELVNLIKRCFYFC